MTPLACREAEVGVTSQMRDTEVGFAVSAGERKHSVASKKKSNIAIAGMLGLRAGVFGAFAGACFEKERGRSQSRAMNSSTPRPSSWIILCSVPLGVVLTG